MCHVLALPVLTPFKPSLQVDARMIYGLSKWSHDVLASKCEYSSLPIQVDGSFSGTDFNRLREGEQSLVKISYKIQDLGVAQKMGNRAC